MCALRIARIINGHTTTMCDQTRHAGMVQFVKNSSKNNVPHLLVLQFCRQCEHHMTLIFRRFLCSRLGWSTAWVSSTCGTNSLPSGITIPCTCSSSISDKLYASMCVSFMLFYCACCKVIAVMDCPFNRITVFYLSLRAPKLCTYVHELPCNMYCNYMHVDL